MRLYGLAAILLAGLAPADRVGAQDVPFDAIVFDDQVTVRSGAGRAYYAVGTLDRNKIVRVVEVFHGWNKIAPPQGVYSYISKGFVNAKGEGDTGVVNRNRAEVKAANLKGPSQSYRTQTELSEGDTVQIVGEEGSYYKIVPPPGTYVFLEPGAVRRAAALEGATEPVDDAEDQADAAQDTAEDAGEQMADTADAAQQDAADTQEDVADDAGDQATALDDQADAADGDATDAADDAVADAADTTDATDAADTADAVDEQAQPDVTEMADTTDTTDAADGDMTPPDAGEVEIDLANAKGGVEDIEVESGDLAEVDAKMVPLFQKPLEQQPIEDMIANYRQFQGDPSLSASDRQLVAMRLAALKHNRKVLAAIQRADAATAEIERVEPERPRPRDYDAVGILRASSVYDGVSMPRMFRVVDATTHRTKAYVTPGGPIKPTMLDKLVGIVGDAEFDPATKLNVIDVEQIVVIDGGQ